MIEGAPCFWMYETSGVLKPAVVAYLHRDELTGEQIAALRAYFRQWVNAPLFRGEDVDELRRTVSDLTSRGALERWLDKAEAAGIDPL